MEIIKLSQIEPEKARPKVILRFCKTNITIACKSAELIGYDNGPEFCIEFAQNEKGDISIRACKQHDDALRFKKGRRGQLFAYNKGVSAYFKKISGSPSGIVPFLISTADQNGWYPMITTYWKTLDKS